MSFYYSPSLESSPKFLLLQRAMEGLQLPFEGFEDKKNQSGILFLSDGEVPPFIGKKVQFVVVGESELYPSLHLADESAQKELSSLLTILLLQNFKQRGADFLEKIKVFPLENQGHLEEVIRWMLMADQLPKDESERTLVDLFLSRNIFRKLEVVSTFPHLIYSEQKKQQKEKVSYYFVQDCSKLIFVSDRDLSNKEKQFWFKVFINLFEQYCSESKNELELFRLEQDEGHIEKGNYAVVSPQGDILLHSKSFIDSGISASLCLQVEDGAKLEVLGIHYRVSKTEFAVNGSTFFKLFFYKASTSSSFRPSMQELGIITSSIAHEISNPLAGILAAIDYLLLEELTEETEETLQEMKEAAKRAQSLSKIFLGFSRKETDSRSTLDLKNTFEQAMSLLRFRMVENKLLFDFPLVVESSFLFPYNDSVMAILLYLILSEVLSSSAHTELLDGKKRDLRKVTGQLVESKSAILFSIDEDFLRLRTFKESKLINHLLSLLSLKLEIVPEGLKMVAVE